MEFMQILKTFGLVAIIGLSQAAAFAGDNQFLANEQIAQANLNSEIGNAYDRALGSSMQADPEFGTGMTKCLNEFPGEQSVHGYFHFTSETSYQLVLEPNTEFSKCLAQALEGFSVPTPPSVPYFNNFTFSTAE